MYTIQVHIANSDPVRLDVEELPSPLDNCVIGKNPRLASEATLPGTTIFEYSPDTGDLHVYQDENAEFEIALWFKKDELVDWQHVIDAWVLGQ